MENTLEVGEAAGPGKVWWCEARSGGGNGWEGGGATWSELKKCPQLNIPRQLLNLYRFLVVVDWRRWAGCWHANPWCHCREIQYIRKHVLRREFHCHHPSFLQFQMTKLEGEVPSTVDETKTILERDSWLHLINVNQQPNISYFCLGDQLEQSVRSAKRVRWWWRQGMGCSWLRAMAFEKLRLRATSKQFRHLGIMSAAV